MVLGQGHLGSTADACGTGEAAIDALFCGLTDPRHWEFTNCMEKIRATLGANLDAATQSVLFPPQALYATQLVHLPVCKPICCCQRSMVSPESLVLQAPSVFCANES